MAAGNRRYSSHDAVVGMACGYHQRFRRIELRCQHVAGAIANSKPIRFLDAFGELDRLVIDANFLARIEIIVDNHPLIATDQRLAQFDRREPLAMYMRDSRSEIEREISDARRLITDRVDRDGGYRNRLLRQNVIEDGEVVNRQIPKHVHIALEESEIDAHGIIVEDLSEIALLNNLPDLADRSRVDERMVDKICSLRRSASSIRSCASAARVVKGFSMKMCLPACSDALPRR